MVLSGTDRPTQIADGWSAVRAAMDTARNFVADEQVYLEADPTKRIIQQNGRGNVVKSSKLGSGLPHCQRVSRRVNTIAETQMKELLVPVRKRSPVLFPVSQGNTTISESPVLFPVSQGITTISERETKELLVLVRKRSPELFPAPQKIQRHGSPVDTDVAKFSDMDDSHLDAAHMDDSRSKPSDTNVAAKAPLSESEDGVVCQALTDHVTLDKAADCTLALLLGCPKIGKNSDISMFVRACMMRTPLFMELPKKLAYQRYDIIAHQARTQESPVMPPSEPPVSAFALLKVAPQAMKWRQLSQPETMSQMDSTNLTDALIKTEADFLYETLIGKPRPSLLHLLAARAESSSSTMPVQVGKPTLVGMPRMHVGPHPFTY